MVTDKFPALLLEKKGDTFAADWVELGEDELMAGDVTIDVSHSTINYKDGLALKGDARIVRRQPMIPGIDLAGTVRASSNARLEPGTPVLVNGYGLGEVHYGGYAGRARLKSEWIVPIPAPFTPAETMAIGTAGYTAMLCVIALEAHGVTPEQGPVLVTGAAGGVGSVAIAVLARLGYAVVASTGRLEEADFLKGLGASEVIDRSELSGSPKPLAKERYAGVVDAVGSNTLANAISQTRYGGTVAACGLAQGMDLPTSVAPFILRGVTLSGIDSVNAPMARRTEAWSRLARDLDRKTLASLTVTRPVKDVTALGPEILAGRVRGRVVLEIGAA